MPRGHGESHRPVVVRRAGHHLGHEVAHLARIARTDHAGEQLEVEQGLVLERAGGAGAVDHLGARVDERRHRRLEHREHRRIGRQERILEPDADAEVAPRLDAGPELGQAAAGHAEDVAHEHVHPQLEVGHRPPHRTHHPEVDAARGHRAGRGCARARAPRRTWACARTPRSSGWGCGSIRRCRCPARAGSSPTRGRRRRLPTSPRAPARDPTGCWSRRRPRCRSGRRRRRAAGSSSRTRWRRPP